MKKKNSNRYKPDRDKRKKAFLHWVRMLLGCIAVITGIPLLSGAFAHSYYALLDAPWPRVEDIRIVGLKRIERKEILNALKIPPGVNVFSLKLPRIVERLEKLPWLRSATVRLDLPGRIVVEVIEREPIALVYVNDFFLMDTEGRLFATTRVEQFPGLFLVTGWSSSDFRDGEMIDLELLDDLRSLLACLEAAQSWFPVHEVSECHWADDEGFTLYTLQGGIPIRLGLGEFDRKLNRLRRTLEVLVSRQCMETVTGIDLDYSNRVYVQGCITRPRGI